MHLDFEFYNPTRIYFGRNALSHLYEELAHFGKNVLLLYGGGSIKKIGLYERVIEILKQADKIVFECGGVMPNPTLKKMMEGAEMVRNHRIDLILAVGGGSVIDCAKGISVAAHCSDEPFRKYWLNAEKTIHHPVVPVGTVLTMVGTGSEMNGGSVITNEELKLKIGRVFPPEVYPKFSILNPEYTFSVPKYQMLSGIFDIMSHLMEQYFSDEEDITSDYLIEGLMRSLLHSTKQAIDNPLAYEARSNIMWTSTMALNRMVGVSKTQDWMVHAIEHQLSAYTDCAHGMGLAAISTVYYRYICPYGLKKFVRFATQVFQVDAMNKTEEEIAEEGLNRLNAFIRESGMATTLKELGATREMLPLIADSCKEGGAYRHISRKEILEILNLCFE